MASVVGLLVALSLCLVPPLSLDSVLAQASISATAFHRDVRQLVVDESYGQVFAPTPSAAWVTRSLQSEFAMVADEDGASWYGFRDVLKDNGKELSGAAGGRLGRALLGPRPASLTEARRIGAEGADHVLLGSGRAANAPTFALMVLLPAHQPRFAFSKRGEKRVQDITVWVIGYHEIRRRMFFRDVEGREVPMTGEFWIDPRSGAVFRSQFVVDSAEAVRGADKRTPSPALEVAAGFSRMEIQVTYRPDRALGVTVPVEMREMFSGEVVTGGGGGPALGDAAATHYLSQRLSCVAKYTDHRRVLASERPDAPPRTPDCCDAPVTIPRAEPGDYDSLA
jgi:hypothetical protein